MAPYEEKSQRENLVRHDTMITDVVINQWIAMEKELRPRPEEAGLQMLSTAEGGTMQTLAGPQLFMEDKHVHTVDLDEEGRLHIRDTLCPDPELTLLAKKTYSEEVLSKPLVVVTQTQRQREGTNDCGILNIAATHSRLGGENSEALHFFPTLGRLHLEKALKAGCIPEGAFPSVPRGGYTPPQLEEALHGSDAERMSIARQVRECGSVVGLEMRVQRRQKEEGFWSKKDLRTILDLLLPTDLRRPAYSTTLRGAYQAHVLDLLPALDERGVFPVPPSGTGDADEDLEDMGAGTLTGSNP
jgi:hypothetical protein